MDLFSGDESLELFQELRANAREIGLIDFDEHAVYVVLQKEISEPREQLATYIEALSDYATAYGSDQVVSSIEQTLKRAGALHDDETLELELELSDDEMRTYGLGQRRVNLVTSDARIEEAILTLRKIAASIRGIDMPPPGFHL